MAHKLLDTIKRLVQEPDWQKEDLDAVSRVLKFLYLRLSKEVRPTYSDFDEAWQDFLLERLLSDDKACLRDLLLHAHDDNEAKGRLRIIFKRYLRRDRKSIRNNKWREVRNILKTDFRLVCLSPDLWAPPGTLSPSRPRTDLSHRWDKWAREFGSLSPVRGDPGSTQLPILVHSSKLREIIEFLFRKADTPLSTTEIFGFIEKVLDFPRWEIFQSGVEIPCEGESGTALNLTTSPEEFSLSRRDPNEALSFLRKLNPAQLCFLCRKTGKGGSLGVPSTAIVFRLLFGISRSTFYESQYRKLCKSFLELQATDQYLCREVVLLWERTGASQIGKILDCSEDRHSRKSARGKRS